MLACRDVAREHGLVMQTHVGEAKYQAASSFPVFGMSMTKTMDSVGIVGPWFSAAHAVWLDDEDMRLLAVRGAQVAHNPGANLRLGSGIAPAREYLRHGVMVGIGTDGCHCSDNQNMFEAMRAASFVSRARGLPPDEWLSTGEVLQMATEGSARVLGFQDRIGRITKGYKASLPSNLRRSKTFGPRAPSVSGPHGPPPCLPSRLRRSRFPLPNPSAAGWRSTPTARPTSNRACAPRAASTSTATPRGWSAGARRGTRASPVTSSRTPRGGDARQNKKPPSAGLEVDP